MLCLYYSFDQDFNIVTAIWQIVDLVGKSLLSPIRDSLYILGLLQIEWLLRSLLIEKWSKRYVIAYILE